MRSICRGGWSPGAAVAARVRVLRRSRGARVQRPRSRSRGTASARGRGTHRLRPPSRAFWSARRGACAGYEQGMKLATAGSVGVATPPIPPHSQGTPRRAAEPAYAPRYPEQSVLYGVVRREARDLPGSGSMARPASPPLHRAGVSSLLNRVCRRYFASTGIPAFSSYARTRSSHEQVDGSVFTSQRARAMRCLLGAGTAEV